MTKAAYETVVLEWEDDITFCRKTLPICWACPKCRGKTFRRLDTRKKCASPLYHPVECRRCGRDSWYAWAVSPSSSAAALRAAPGRTLFAKIRDWRPGANVDLYASHDGNRCTDARCPFHPRTEEKRP